MLLESPLPQFYTEIGPLAQIKLLSQCLITLTFELIHYLISEIHLLF